jgi:excisionase family DNA binding protein
MKSIAIPEHKSNDQLWSTKDLAKFLGCSERQIPRLRDEGLPSVRVGGLVRFVPSRVMAWLDARSQENHAADERARQLADIAASADEDNAECAAADLAREFPSHAP